jgi:hypothetical protein
MGACCAVLCAPCVASRQMAVMQAATQEQLVHAGELMDKFAQVDVIRTHTRRGVVLSNTVTVKPLVVSAIKESAAAFAEDLAFGALTLSAACWAATRFARCARQLC